VKARVVIEYEWRKRVWVYEIETLLENYDGVVWSEGRMRVRKWLRDLMSRPRRIDLIGKSGRSGRISVESEWWKRRDERGRRNGVQSGVENLILSSFPVIVEVREWREG